MQRRDLQPTKVCSSARSSARRLRCCHWISGLHRPTSHADEITILRVQHRQPPTRWTSRDTPHPPKLQSTTNIPRATKLGLYKPDQLCRDIPRPTNKIQARGARGVSHPSTEYRKTIYFSQSTVEVTKSSHQLQVQETRKVNPASIHTPSAEPNIRSVTVISPRLVSYTQRARAEPDFEGRLSDSRSFLFLSHRC